MLSDALRLVRLLLVLVTLLYLYCHTLDTSSKVSIGIFPACKNLPYLLYLERLYLYIVSPLYIQQYNKLRLQFAIPVPLKLRANPN